MTVGASFVFSGALNERVANHQPWSDYLAPLLDRSPAYSVHLAIFIEPFLRYVLEGRKTIESRFSQRPIAPYKAVEPGDVILLKQSGGPVVAICRAVHVWDHQLTPASWRAIREQAEALCATDPLFWEQRKEAKYATLIKIEDVRKLSVPLPVVKRDRRGWVVLQQRMSPLTLPL
jgi:hypothetical protein